jgi:hypothetical protein
MKVSLISTLPSSTGKLEATQLAQEIKRMVVYHLNSHFKEDDRLPPIETIVEVIE